VTLAAFTEAQHAQDMGLMRQHLTQLQQLITQGSTDAAQWSEIQHLWASRCKLIQTEQRTLIAERQMVTVEQLMVYFGVITDAINRIVPAHTDPASARAILGALSTEFARISVLENGAEA